MNRPRKTPATLEKLAAYKDFAAEWLAQVFGVSDNGGAGVVIPYRHLDGTAARSQVRKFVETSHPSFWTVDGNRITVYTSQKTLNEAKVLGWLTICEGPSDVWALALHGFPALGVPGATMCKYLEAAHLAGIPKVYVVREPGEAGALFVERIAQRALELGSTTEVYALDLQAFCGVKDPGELHIRDQGAFALEFMQAIEKAERVQLSEAKPEANGRASGVLDLVDLSTVEPEQVSWLWNGRIPRAKVTVLAGDPGAGKSFLSVAISAAITGGPPLPDDDAVQPTSGRVIMWNGEDGIADTIRPRADACGMDTSKCTVVRGTLDAEGKCHPFSLADVAQLEDEIEGFGDVAALVIDPIQALLGGVDSHKDAETRAALQCLVTLAERTGVAVIVVMHLRKAEAQKALYRVSGSIAFVAFARSVLLVAVDEETGRRAIAPLKHNLCAAPKPVEFSIDEEGAFSWGAVAEDLDAERLLRAPQSRSNEQEPSASDKARSAILRTLLSGEASADELTKAVTAAGVSVRTLERTRKAMHDAGEIERFGGGKAGAVGWRLSAIPCQ
ncbi:MAG: AAA family ATPase [Candidatus Cybelea sp.]